MRILIITVALALLLVLLIPLVLEACDSMLLTLSYRRALPVHWRSDVKPPPVCR